MVIFEYKIHFFRKGAEEGKYWEQIEHLQQQMNMAKIPIEEPKSKKKKRKKRNLKVKAVHVKFESDEDTSEEETTTTQTNEHDNNDTNPLESPFREESFIDSSKSTQTRKKRHRQIAHVTNSQISDLYQVAEKRRKVEK